MARPLPTLSAENRLRRKILDLGCTAQFVAALDGGLSPSRLSQALSGIKVLENKDAERLLALCDKCIVFRDAFLPVPVSFSEPGVIRPLLDKLAVEPEDVQRTISDLFRE
jgi:hypothetical protein